MDSLGVRSLSGLAVEGRAVEQEESLRIRVARRSAEAGGAVELDEEEVQRLRALGYLQ